MKILVDINDKKVPFFTELLSQLSFVRALPLPGVKPQLETEIERAVKELTLVKQGKLKTRPVEDLLNEGGCQN